MFELSVPSVVAGGEVMNGQCSPLSPENTVIIPLSDYYTFTDTVRARGLNCGGGNHIPRVDGRFVIYLGLYGNRGDNPLAPLPVPRAHGAPVGNTNAADSQGTWKKRTCKECNKTGNRYSCSLNGDQLHKTCVAVFEKKQKAKEDNGGCLVLGA